MKSITFPIIDLCDLRLRSVNMFATNLMCFYLSLIFAALPQDATSTPVNKTTADGKVFITGDHNEVVVSTALATKKALADIKSEVNSLNEKDKKFTERILSLETHIGRKLKLMNQSNTALSEQVQAMSQRLTTLEKHGIYALYFY